MIKQQNDLQNGKLIWFATYRAIGKEYTHLYIAIADFTDNKRALIELLRLLSGALFGSGRRGHPGDGHMSGGTRARPQQTGNVGGQCGAWYGRDTDAG